MIRVVLDTNVVVSALLAPRGNEAQTIRLALSGILLPCVSDAILSEYRRVIGRPRFSGLPPDRVSEVLAMLAQGHRVEPGFSLSVSLDPSDNRFLECAEAADAEYLVTGNKRHFPDVWKNTAVVNARELLGRIRLPE